MFASVAKGWMADVMDQCEGFGQGRIEAECASGSAGDLGYFKSVREAASGVIALEAAACEYLCLAGKTAKGLGVKDTPDVTHECGAVGMSGFGAGATRERIGRGFRD